MNRNYKLKISLTIAVAGVISACSAHNSPQSVSGNTCTKSALPGAAIVSDLNSLSNMDSSDHISLILKVKNVGLQFEALRAELVAAHESSAKTLGKLKLVCITKDLISIDLPKGSPALALIEAKILAQEILYAEPDYKTFLVDPAVGLNLLNDPDLTKQWAQQKMDTYDAWKTTQGSKDLIVAVVDTGVDYTHKDLAASMWRNPNEILNGLDDDNNGYVDDIYGYDFSNNDSNPMADDAGTYHGTHVSGTIAASLGNQLGGAGVAPGVKIMALKYLNQFGSGSTSDAIRAIEYAIHNGAKIINNSWGSMGRSQALQDAIEHARLKGVLFVAAAGNGDYKGNGINLDITPFYPAAYPNDNVVSVAASDINDGLAKWSNFGTHVDVAAPGVNIYSTRNGNTYASLSGTSMATPAVTGVLGLIWSANPKLSYLDVKKILLSSVDPIPAMKSKILSGGRVNAARAVQVAAGLNRSGPAGTGSSGLVPDQCTP